MLITRLEYQKTNPKKVNIFVDGQYALSLSAEEVVKRGLKAGQEVSIEELQGASTREKIYGGVLRFLGIRNRSEGEIRKYLKNKSEIRPASPNRGENSKFENTNFIEEIVEKLRNVGLVDDEKFAREWVDQRRRRLKGDPVIAQELKEKGTAEEIITSALELQEGTRVELERAKEALRKKVHGSQFPVQSKVDSKIERLKLISKLQRYLVGRGFGWETAKEAVAQLLGKGYNND